MLVQVIDELHHAPFHRAGDGDVVEHRQVLHVLAQADAAGVRADRHAELRGHQDHRQLLVHAAQPAAVDLAEVDRVRLEELLEDDAVRAVLARRDADAGAATAFAIVAWPSTSSGLVGSSIHQGLKARSARMRSIASPTSQLLVGVDHQRAVGTDLLADQRDPPLVVVRRRRRPSP